MSTQKTNNNKTRNTHALVRKNVKMTKQEIKHQKEDQKTKNKNYERWFV